MPRVGRAQEGDSPSRKGGSEDLLRENCSIINACKWVLMHFGSSLGAKIVILAKNLASLT